MAERLKDMYLTEESLGKFVNELVKFYSEFDKEKFFAAVKASDWEELELKQRMRQATLCLNEVMPKDYRESIKILEKAAPNIKGMEAMVLPDFVEVNGMSDWEISLPALKHFTQFSSSEFAIRPFLNENVDQAMKLMYECAESEIKNIRRFASEGCRPRLPWAMALPGLKKNPEPIIPVLEKLKDDESEFVRRSVANNLNDISKDNPDIVLDLAEKWYGQSENTDKIIKHALRSLLKAGDVRALRLFGFGDPKNLLIEDFTLNRKSIKIGEDDRFSFDLMVNEKSKKKIRLEYALHFMKANGKQSPKIFQIVEKEFEPGKHSINRKYVFVQQTTRKIYPGEHIFAIIVNGEEKARKSILVKE